MRFLIRNFCQKTAWGIFKYICLGKTNMNAVLASVVCSSSPWTSVLLSKPVPRFCSLWLLHMVSMIKENVWIRCDCHTSLLEVEIWVRIPPAYHKFYKYLIFLSISHLLLLLLLLLKKVSSARLWESNIHLISPKTPAPQYQPIDRKKRKGERVEDYSRDRAA